MSAATHTRRIRPVDLRKGMRLVMADGSPPVTVTDLCAHTYRLAYTATQGSKVFHGSVLWTQEMEVVAS